MRNITLFSLAFLCTTFLIFSQNDPEIDYAGELVKSVEIPNSPEAAAFEKYGNTSVSMYTGTPNISVPIYTIKGKEMNLPISLSYDASGIKVEQLASQVGLSWTLSVGGRISRVVNGLPDNYSNGDYATIFKTAGYSAQTVRNNILNYALISNDFTSLQAGYDYINFLKDINKNNVDTEPDYYSLNAPGLSDHIVFDLNTMLPKTLKNPRIKVIRGLTGGDRITSWTITNDDGANYYFEAYESTWAEGNDEIGVGGIIKEYASSWVLTKIESPNKKDIYEFTYNNNPYNTPFNYWTQPAQITASSVTNTDYIGSGITEFPGIDTQVLFSPTYKIKQLYLTQITHNGRITVDFELGSREDIDKNINSALKSVTIYDFNNLPLKKYDLHQSYFGITSATNPQTKQVHEIRLKLDSIQVLGSDLNRYASYQFDYFSPESVPHTRSTDQDYLGYYNGAGNPVDILYKDVTIEGLHFHGANRDSDFNNAIKGTLKKITYPTGGTTEFQYQSHAALSPPQSNTTDITYGHVSVAGGNGDAGDIAECGNCCQDKFQTAPKISHQIFQITDPDTYKITYLETGGNADGEAYIIPVSGPTSYINYDDFTNPCTADNAFWQDNNGPPGPSTYAHFPTGYYQITVVNKTSGTNLSLRIHRLETSTSPSNQLLAGLRIQKITDNPEMGQATVEKTYQYTKTITGTESSGKIIFNPKLYFFTNTVVQQSGSSVTKRTINRVAQAAGGSQPHVTYSKVYEIEQDNGHIEHNFNTGVDGIVARPGPPFSNRFVSNFGVGKESSVHTYSDSNTLVTSDTKQYNDTFQHSVLGFGTINEASRKFQYVAFENIGSIYRLTYVNALIQSNGNATLPSVCNPSNGMYCMNNNELALLDPFNTLASGRSGHLSRNELFGSYTNGTTNKVIDYLYYDNNLLKETKTTDSEDLELKTINYYTGDVANGGIYEDMVNENRLNTIIKTESYYDGIKTGTQETAYKKWSSNVYSPQFLKMGKGSQTPKERLEYHSLYTNGNVKEVSLKNGPKTVYIWGYDETFPIAKIENADYSQVSSQVSNLQTKSDQDDDRTLGILGKEGELRDALTGLRNSLPDAMVTTFTYDPLIGVTSITDPSGQIIYYHYDNFNRLTHVMDKDGKVINKNVYNYNNQN